MDVIQKSDGGWAIIHAGKEVDIDFDTEAKAWSWADEFIDDQVFDSPNWLCEPIVYRTAVLPTTTQ